MTLGVSDAKLKMNVLYQYINKKVILSQTHQEFVKSPMNEENTATKEDTGIVASEIFYPLNTGLI
jgi:hypothetical protein